MWFCCLCAIGWISQRTVAGRKEAAKQAVRPSGGRRVCGGRGVCTMNHTDTLKNMHIFYLVNKSTRAC